VSVRTRAGLRFLAWLVATFTGVALAGFAIAGLPNAVGYAVLVVVVLGVSFASWRTLDRRAPSETPLAVSGAPRGFAHGAVVGAGLVVVVVAILAVLGVYDLAPRSCRPEPLLRFLAGTVTLVTLAAVFEETLFRGYALFSLRDLLGRRGAIAVTASIFALGHQANPGFGWAAATNLAFVGAVLGAWVIAEGDVWPAIGAHAGWNAAIVAGAAVPVSGIPLPAPCHAGVLAGPDWLTGGAFGLEAGLPTTVAWGGLGLWLFMTRGRRRPPD
jgi:membrane protease YdiL (CAAX protease family)